MEAEEERVRGLERLKWKQLEDELKEQVLYQKNQIRHLQQQLELRDYDKRSNNYYISGN